MVSGWEAATPHPKQQPYFFFFLAAFFFAIVRITSFVREMCYARVIAPRYFFFFLAAFFFAIDWFTPLLSLPERAHGRFAGRPLQ